MDKRALEKFATSARIELIEKVTQKAKHYGFTTKGVAEKRKIGDSYFVNDLMLTSKEEKAWSSLNSHINKVNTNDDYKRAFKSVIEEVAYTWFNRLVALRFMEAHNYLPTRVRVTSSIHGGADPDILREALNIDLDVDKEYVYSLKQDNKRNELYKYMIIKQCDALTDILPFLFDKTHDYVELLFPDNLLADDAIVDRMINTIPEDNWDNVEIIGWLYQYYISDRKDEVFAGLKKNKKIQKEDIAPATQLFTPEWIVRYMVQNSLGRLWAEGHETKLKDTWKYYLEEASQEDSVEKQLVEIRKESSQLKLEDIKILDPSMGSGHILVYAFDLLYDIYEEQGYVQSEISQLIIENNLYGLDIDYRAAQLAYFAVMMKGRSKDRRFFTRNVKPNIYAIEQSNGLVSFEHDSGQLILEDEHKETANHIISAFKNALEYGSLVKVESRDYDGLLRYIYNLEHKGFNTLLEQSWYESIKESLPILIELSKVLSAKYDVVCTNPPYMGSNGMNAMLSSYIKRLYPNTKSDLSTVFMELSLDMCKPNGRISMINIPVWMFIKSYEALRARLITSHTIETMLHFGRGIFGSDFGTTGFVIKNNFVDNYIGIYRKLYKKQGAVDNILQKEKWFFDKLGEYKINNNNFTMIPGMPIAYWISDKLIASFINGAQTNKLATPKQGMSTCDVNRFVKMWCEPSIYDTNILERKKQKKWIVYNKGGDFRKWYGNREYLVLWNNNGDMLRKNNAALRNTDSYFKEFIAWTKISSCGTGFRDFEEDFLFDGAGGSLFLNNNSDKKYVLGFLNTIVCQTILDLISPTLNFNESHIGSLPIIIKKAENERVSEIVCNNINISKTDWDTFETSWDFKKHPLLSYKSMSGWEDEPLSGRIKQAFKSWQRFKEQQFNKLKTNEEELNRIFIEIYDLADELTPGVEDKDVTVYRVAESKDELDYKSNYIIDKSDVIKSFISYAVGCMFGRYSPYNEGLIYAGGEWNYGKLQNELWEAAGDSIKEKLERSPDGFIIGDFILPDVDNVIPITDDNYFSDDIVGEFVKFVKECFGEEYLDENIEYIADSLNPKASETPKETIRRYFLNDFYKDHVQTYKKRPIYWLFTSGKQKAFNALIYMHRYDKSTLARIRTDYLHRQQNILEAKRSRLAEALKTESNKLEQVKLNKEITMLDKQLDEIRVYDEKLHHLADQMIEIDLDDGVVENYKLFDGLVGKI